MIADRDEDERAHSRRYTEDGINVVALDRRSRGLHRARPEQRFPTVRRAALTDPPRSRLPAAIFAVLLLAALALAIVRLTS